MKNAILKTKYVLLALVILLTFSCAEDGAVGPQGSAGKDGTNGLDGQDGNANVQTYRYNLPTWDQSGSGLRIDMSGILTDDILENDVILSYVKHTDAIIVSPIPGKVFDGAGYRVYAVLIGNSEESNFPGAFGFGIVSFLSDGTFTPNLSLRAIDWVKIIVIKSTNTTTANGNGRTANAKVAILDELASAGVDINNYDEVLAYYGK